MFVFRRETADLKSDALSSRRQNSLCIKTTEMQMRLKIRFVSWEGIKHAGRAEREEVVVR